MKYCLPCIIAAQPCDDCRGNNRTERSCQDAEYILSPYKENNTVICEPVLERQLSRDEPLAVDDHTINGLRLLRQPEPPNASE